MTRRPFTVTIPDEVARRMTRKDYYEARSYMRRVRRLIKTQFVGIQETVYTGVFKQLSTHGRVGFEVARYTDGREEAIGVVLLPHEVSA